MKVRLRQTREWVFDLDNTLYPPESDLFAQIDQRMTQYVSELLNLPPDEARKIQKAYYAEHGTTMSGLMQEHNIEPDSYLDFVHDIDLSPLSVDQTLQGAIAALPGRKIVFTNGSRGHANRVLAARGLNDLFDDIIGIEDTGFVPKPQPQAYAHLLDNVKVDPAQAAFIEDMARNLEPAHALGFVTILVHSDKDWSHEPEGARPAGVDDDHDHVHFTTGDLAGFLKNAIKD
ncbi:MAG: pyrimidine 5'-nucleotidase [Robiginitomaculum sp.]|nr:MAG: pyrimidine 5'-nucleotidase [Robiginitomaculum sp.]